MEGLLLVQDKYSIQYCPCAHHQVIFDDSKQMFTEFSDVRTCEL